MDPPLCANGCGFDGSVQNLNLCSMCFKEHRRKEHAKSAGAVPVPPPSPAPAPVKAELALAGLTINDTKITTAAVSSSNLQDSASMQRKTNRCSSCNKKVGLTGFECRCGLVFCGKHRYPEEHGCWFDYKTAGREALIKQNSLLQGDKIQNRI